MTAYKVHDKGSVLAVTADGRELTSAQIYDLLQRLTRVATILRYREMVAAWPLGTRVTSEHLPQPGTVVGHCRAPAPMVIPACHGLSVQTAADLVPLVVDMHNVHAAPADVGEEPAPGR
ncbi:hypothetical protein LG943_10785 [Streptomonospora sp. S1-112]|uniref:Uncharacterized protein n=1 Tax=Streptomonospora mangrovi TaxID=2883123 RepID=A0A9X3NKS2_9ACTN|nr:hypothetical protein [Streptomonospora mangrovi]MDA0564805.1 hypothetical protein [Streptomonospora mangrovi]